MFVNILAIIILTAIITACIRAVPLVLGGAREMEDTVKTEGDWA